MVYLKYTNPVSNHRFVHLCIQHHPQLSLFDSVWFILALDPLFWPCQTPSYSQPLHPCLLISERVHDIHKHLWCSKGGQRMSSQAQYSSCHGAVWKRVVSVFNQHLLACPQPDAERSWSPKASRWNLSLNFELWRYTRCLEVDRNKSNKCQKIHWNTSRVGLLLPKEAMERLRLVKSRGWGTGWKLNKVGISEFADHVRQHPWWAQTPGQERVSEPKAAIRHTEASHQCLSFLENTKSPYKIVDLVAMFPKRVEKLLGELKEFLKVWDHHTYAKNRLWSLRDTPLILNLAASSTNIVDYKSLHSIFSPIQRTWTWNFKIYPNLSSPPWCLQKFRTSSPDFDKPMWQCGAQSVRSATCSNSQLSPAGEFWVGKPPDGKPEKLCEMKLLIVQDPHFCRD